MKIARIIDDIAPGPLVVFGSLPPDARDLDLLIRDRDIPELASQLAALRFVSRGSTFVSFQGCDVEAIDLVPVSEWLLDPSEKEAIFAEAVPLEGYVNLRRPAPAHALLILARRLVASGGRMTDKLAAKLAAIESDSFDVWDQARARAESWGAEPSLKELAEAASTGQRVGRIRRARAVTQAESSRGAGTLRAAGTGLLSVTHLPKRPVIVSFSGLDGSGKTTQATNLKNSLEKLGWSTELEWSRLTFNPSLNVVAAPVKAVARLVSRGGTAPKVSSTDDAETQGRDPGAKLRRRSPTVALAWACIVSVANGLTHRRLTRDKRRVDVIITDRYVLDSVVHLRHRYAAGARMRLPAALVRALSPRPARSYFLDVRAETSLARKDDEFGIDELREQAALYREETSRHNVTRLDGERPMDELCETVARDVWAALR